MKIPTVPALPNIFKRYAAFAPLRPWLRPTIFLLVGIGVVLAGSTVSSNPKTQITFIAAVLAVLMALWIAVQPKIGVYLLTVFVYLNLSDILQVQFGIPSINKAVVGLVFVSILANRLVLQHKPFVFRRSDLLLLIYFLITLFSVFTADDPALAQTGGIDNLKDFVIILIIVQVCDDEQPWRQIHWVILLSAVLVATLSCYQVLTHNYANTFLGLATTPVAQITNFDSQRIAGPLGDPNYYGQILLMALPLGLYPMISDKRRNYRLLAIACTVPIVLAIVFTYSRGAFITLIVIGVLIVRERKLNYYKVMAGLALILVVTIPLLPAGYMDRLVTLTSIFPQDVTLQSEVSFKGRSSEMIIAVQMFLDNPIVGVGYANYEINYAAYNALLGLDPRFGQREPHDLFLEILAENGIIGFIAFAAAITALFRGIQRARRQFLTLRNDELASRLSSIELGIVAFFVTSIFLHGAYIRYLWLFVGVAGGGMVLAEALIRKQRETLLGREANMYVQRETINL
jgi:O-antigen ligase